MPKKSLTYNLAAGIALFLISDNEKIHGYALQLTLSLPAVIGAVILRYSVSGNAKLQRKKLSGAETC
jgi:hypothetical protein